MGSPGVLLSVDIPLMRARCCLECHRSPLDRAARTIARFLGPEACQPGTFLRNPFGGSHLPRQMQVYGAQYFLLKRGPDEDIDHSRQIPTYGPP